MFHPSGVNSDPSASSIIGNNYYVFLSFRGPDTRNGFVDHLYHRLKDVGLPFHPNFMFRDDKDLPFGEKIGENLINAIKHSKVSIPVISENYAASEWCLRELIWIMECMERGEQKVLPVLYKVKPYEVRELEGAFGEAFKSRKDEFEEEVKQQGPVALIKALELRVFESEKFANGHEAELIKELIRVITDEQRHNFLPPLPGNLVGIDDRVAEFMKLVDTDPSEIRIIGICGIGGIGKTTLATNIYNKLAKKFEWHSFLMDVRETINRKGMEHIQSLLISDITKNHESKVRDSMRGIGKIQLSCKKKKVLILLDDVGHRDHIDKLIGGCDLELGSTIIITCRDKALLKSEYRSYELKEMNSIDSMLLFSLYAFEAKQPPTDFMILSSDIVGTTGGLPLALEIIGSFLKRKKKSIWIETLEKLRKVPHTDVQKKLKISYNALEHNEKQMFLDIACFFIGYDERFATYLWKDLQLHPNSGLARMIELSLIKYGNDNKLRMHDQLRDLGRAIAHPEGMQPWLCSRLWGEETMKVLKRKMERLKVLNLSRCYNLRRIPNLSTSKNLEMLILEDCISLEEIDPSIKDVKCLISLNLSRCRRLEELPEQLNELENLEELIADQTRIKEIPPHIGSLKQLKRLNVAGGFMLEAPNRLQELPSSIRNLGELVELDLSRTGIKELPKFIGELNKLKILRISSSEIIRIPSSIGKLQSLQELVAYGCNGLKGQIHFDKGGLTSLKTLHLGHTSISHLPENLDQLSSLEHLHLRHTQISSLPKNLDQLSSLEHLDLFGCKELKSLPKPPFSLSSLLLTCRSNELSSLSHLKHLQELTLHECMSLQSIPSLSHLKHLHELVLYRCKSLQNIPELPSCIRTLNVKGCPKLERLPNLSDWEFLSELQLIECNGLKQLDGLESLKSLRVFDLSRALGFDSLKDVEEADNLHAIRGLEKLGSLEMVCFYGREHIQVLDLSMSEHLKWLNVRDCKSLVEIHCPSKFLKDFYRDGCVSLKKFPDILRHDGP